MPRFFVERGSDDFIEIVGDDAKHISHSLRMKVGEQVTVCDFSNLEYSCVIDSFTDSAVHLKVLGKKLSEAEATIKVTVYQAMPKGDKFETVVQKAVELGAYGICPVLTERCVSRPDPKSLSKKCERWQKIAKEAAMLSGRAAIPFIGEGFTFEQAVEKMKQDDFAFFCYEKETEVSLRKVLCEHADELGTNLKNVSFLVGSEGGISDAEARKLKDTGIPSVTLGKRILRTETAPLAVLSALMFHTGNLE